MPPYLIIIFTAFLLATSALPIPLHPQPQLNAVKSEEGTCITCLRMARRWVSAPIISLPQASSLVSVSPQTLLSKRDTTVSELSTRNGDKTPGQIIREGKTRLLKRLFDVRSWVEQRGSYVEGTSDGNGGASAKREEKADQEMERANGGTPTPVGRV